MRKLKWLDEHFEGLLLTICLLLILAVSFLQVIIRKLPGVNALTWAEEFCRFLWIFSVFLSLPYCIKKRSMLRVSVLADALPDGAAHGLRLVLAGFVLLAMLLLALVSVSVVAARLESGELSPAMLLPMWIVYAVMLLGYLLASLRALQVLCAEIRNRKKEG